MTDEAGAGLIDAARLRAVVERTTESLRQNPGGGIIRPFVDSRLLSNVAAEAEWEQAGRSFSVRSDEPAGRGGNGENPTAIRYFLSGIAFCLQVWYAKAAALLDCELEDVHIRVEAALDMRGSAWYRTQMVRVWVRRALEDARGAAQGGTAAAA